LEARFAASCSAFVKVAAELTAARNPFKDAARAWDVTNALQLAANLASNASVTVGTVQITMANRYPAADMTATGILGTIQTDPGIFTSSSAVLNVVTFQATAASNPANCSFTYTNTAANPGQVSQSTVTQC